MQAEHCGVLTPCNVKAAVHLCARIVGRAGKRHGPEVDELDFGEEAQPVQLVFCRLLLLQDIVLAHIPVHGVAIFCKQLGLHELLEGGDRDLLQAHASGPGFQDGLDDQGYIATVQSQVAVEGPAANNRTLQ